MFRQQLAKKSEEGHENDASTSKTYRIYVISKEAEKSAKSKALTAGLRGGWWAIDKYQ